MPLDELLFNYNIDNALLGATFIATTDPLAGVWDVFPYSLRKGWLRYIFRICGFKVKTLSYFKIAKLR